MLSGHRRGVLALVFGLSALLAPRAVLADEVGDLGRQRGPFDRATASDASRAGAGDDRARLSFLVGRLEAGYPRAALWYDVWTYGFTASAALQGAVAATTSNPNLRARATIGYYTSTLATLSMVLLPQPSVYGTEGLRKLPETSALEVRHKVAEAERVLERAAKIERLGRSWLAYTSALAVSASSGLVLWRYYDRPGAALFLVAVSVPIGQLKIATQPTSSIRAWDEYREKYGVSGR